MMPLSYLAALLACVIAAAGLTVAVAAIGPALPVWAGLLPLLLSLVLFLRR